MADIIYHQYQNESQLPSITKLIESDLSEPYSIYTYRYFLHNFPELCFLASRQESIVGVVICKIDPHKEISRGYIGMLAVDRTIRKAGIGSKLVKTAIQALKTKGVDEIILETEVTNLSAIAFYERLGFVRDKRMRKYYLNGVDAFRLKFWLK